MLQWDFKCKLCCKAFNIFKMFNGSLGHVPVVERPQIYFFDSCIAPKMVMYELPTRTCFCKGNFTQNCSSTVNSKRKVYNTQLQEVQLKMYRNVASAIKTEFYINTVKRCKVLSTTDFSVSVSFTL
jgi:hypothetical protein